MNWLAESTKRWITFNHGLVIIHIWWKKTQNNKRMTILARLALSELFGKTRVLRFWLSQHMHIFKANIYSLLNIEITNIDTKNKHLRRTCKRCWTSIFSWNWNSSASLTCSRVSLLAHWGSRATLNVYNDKKESTQMS